ncbi:MAG: hypothetical protein RSD40_06290 [Bacilli bacterium]
MLKEISLPVTLPNDTSLYYFIQVLNSGNIIVYGEGGPFKDSKKLFICNPSTETTMRQIISSMSNDFIDSAPTTDIDETKPGNQPVYTQVRLFNVIPIIDNRNIMVFQRFHGKVKANVSFALVDDNFNPIYPSLDTNKP